MPEVKKKVKRPWIKERKPQEGRHNNNQKMYNSTAWRQCSRLIRQSNPICEVCKTINMLNTSDVTDHIITINEGGSVYDGRNHMAMCHHHHNIKSGKEKHQAILIPWTLNAHDEKIPQNRNDIIKLLTNV